jgi:flavin-dependent dehydrogenase
MSRDHDVAVVGASLAGCTAATLLGRAGRRRDLGTSPTKPRRLYDLGSRA